MNYAFRGPEKIFAVKILMINMDKTIVKGCLILILAGGSPVRAFQPFKVPGGGSAPASGAAETTIDFCARGKLLIFTGNCVLPKNSVFKDSISQKACEDVKASLIPGLGELYPQAKVYAYNGLEPDAVYAKLMTPAVLGLFLIGEGNVKGGMIAGESRKILYPSKDACLSKLDVFGGFISHSRYSPDSPAPAALRRRMLARMQLVEGGAGEPSGSWPRLCGPEVSLVYPTRTFAGRMKEDAKKLLAGLAERKRAQALNALETICGACDQYIKAGYPLAKLCPPNSDVCVLKRITPGSEKLVMDNYCLALHPENK